MKIARIETAILSIPEDEPLADAPARAGTMRPVVALRLATDDGIEGIGLTFFAGRLTGALRARQEACPGPSGRDERLRLGAEMSRLAQRTGSPRTAMWGALWRIDALIESGHLADAGRSTEKSAAASARKATDAPAPAKRRRASTRS